jgi:excisionase family DNA binding protein
MSTEMDKQPQEYMTRAELAKELRVGERTVDSWVSRGVLPCIRIGRVTRFHRATVQDYLKKHYEHGGRN